jgi:hypothetical protein
MDKPTDSEIIDRLGGTSEVARICQIKPPSVSEWRATGIPSARRQYLELLRPDVFGPEGSSDRSVIGRLVDSRMSKRALRARLGLSSDVHLAKVLKLPVEQVAAWHEEQGVPPLPQVLQLLGVQEQPVADAAPNDPDAERVIQVQVA